MTTRRCTCLWCRLRTPFAGQENPISQEAHLGEGTACMDHPCLLRGPCHCSDQGIFHAGARLPHCTLAPSSAGLEKTTPACIPAHETILAIEPSKHPAMPSFTHDKCCSWNPPQWSESVRALRALLTMLCWNLMFSGPLLCAAGASQMGRR